MANSISRRAALGGVGAALATVGIGSSARAEELLDPKDIKTIGKVYYRQKELAGGRWHSHVSAVGELGDVQTVIDDDIDFVTNAYSVQKVALAMTVMDKIDRGELTLDQKLDLPGSLILGGSGIYHLHTVWGDQITIANFLTALLLMSDNTAVRMCGRVVPALEVNAILAAKGFVHTRVIPVANPNRFFLGVTTPREVSDLMWRLANKTLLSPSSCDFLLRIMRWVNGYHDGIRRNMSSNERSRVATKYGADFNTLGAQRNEAGIMFDTTGAPTLVYSLFADSLTQLDNYGATHPAVQAHATLGRTMFDAIGDRKNAKPAAHHVVGEFRQVSGD